MGFRGLAKGRAGLGWAGLGLGGGEGGQLGSINQSGLVNKKVYALGQVIKVHNLDYQGVRQTVPIFNLLFSFSVCHKGVHP